ncbi:recombinase family protein [Gehongia tenuis]|uniref:Recombinase family protein n=1 Tax=Gehongia tenuis TaxID=2763655 RepID=A0A926HQ42_9FIRM|nr:recombinase family protein [Gehongia tenuis]MBC8530856.1 recombinase family protein [Gehongia tenuis]
MDDRRVVIYCRESRDDFGEHRERIETQRDMLVRFCARRGLSNIVDIILDNNVSGTRFERLADLEARMEAGEVDVVVFKDASRLGRNQMESLRFVELAQELGVELLFESEDFREDLFGLMAWFNERRAREDSEKIRRVMRHKMEAGELIIRAPYGYEKTESGLQIREEEARVVREVFRDFTEGRSVREIVGRLNGARVPTPSMVPGERPAAEHWTPQHIYRILGNEVYTGTMIHGKTMKRSFKSARTVSRPREEWIVLPNHHEAIVSEELFHRAAALKCRGGGKHSPSLYSGLVRCGRCGKPLVRGRGGFLCGTYHREGALKEDGGCLRHFLAESELAAMTAHFLRILGEAAGRSEIPFTRQLARHLEAVYFLPGELAGGVLPEELARQVSREGGVVFWFKESLTDGMRWDNI